ncbi:MAG: TonB-dependent receptor, partial [Cytophagales bacterium]|nr:TonB-dependent receptor [Cytophagales bacterium]
MRSITIMIFKRFLVLLFLCVYSSAYAQKFTISGTIKDAKNGEDLIGATVVVEETRAAAATNQYGYYSLTIPQGPATLIFSYIGYSSVKKKVDLKENLKLNISLSEEAIQTQEVVITEKRPDANVSEMKMSKVEMNLAQLKKLPPLFGEPDIIKLVQLQPGVVTAGEGTGAFFVRGGSADQNLILYDEAPVYDPTHIFGLIGAFNTSIVKTADLFKGGIPAQYGGRLSSVLDVKSIDGNTKRFSGGASIGTLAFRANVQGPI